MDEKYPYGQCKRCKEAVEIPGSDGYKCSKCGWVRVEIFHTTSKKVRGKR